MSSNSRTIRTPSAPFAIRRHLLNASRPCAVLTCYLIMAVMFVKRAVQLVTHPHVEVLRCPCPRALQRTGAVFNAMVPVRRQAAEISVRVELVINRGGRLGRRTGQRHIRSTLAIANTAAQIVRAAIPCCAVVAEAVRSRHPWCRCTSPRKDGQAALIVITVSVLLGQAILQIVRGATRGGHLSSKSVKNLAVLWEICCDPAVEF